MKSVIFFNNKGGVGKTTLVYHLAWMFSRCGVRTLAVDLDPQANLTSSFFDADVLELLWAADAPGTLYSCLLPRITTTGDIGQPTPAQIDENLWLLSGHLGVSRFEDQLAQSWGRTLAGEEGPLRDTSAFFRIIQGAAASVQAELTLIDVGPNLGAINRAALISADYLVVPLAADLFSIQGLKNLGPTVRKWSGQWQDLLKRLAEPPVALPYGHLRPVGYVAQSSAMRLDRPAYHYAKWLEQMPAVYAREVLDGTRAAEESHEALATLRHYRSLIPMAQEARRPMFLLRAADGAIGSHVSLVETCRKDFEALAHALAGRIGLTIPEPFSF